jgi:hypothetical protein
VNLTLVCCLLLGACELIHLFVRRKPAVIILNCNCHHRKVRHPGDLAHGIFMLLCNMNPKYKFLFEIWNYTILGTYMQPGEL